MARFGPIQSPAWEPYSRAVLRTPGLLSHWPLNETSGTLAADVMGVRPGTYTAAPTLGQRGPLASSPDGAVLLNGSSQYITASDVGLPINGAARSMIVWVNAAAWASANGYLVGYGTTGWLAQYVLFYQGVGTLRVLLGSGAASSWAGVPTDGAWNMFGLAWDGTHHILVLNGASLGNSGGQTPDATTLGGSFCIGAAPGGGSNFLGATVAQTSVLNRALSPGEFASLYLSART